MTWLYAMTSMHWHNVCNVCMPASMQLHSSLLYSIKDSTWSMNNKNIAVNLSKIMETVIETVDEKDNWKSKLSKAFTDKKRLFLQCHDFQFDL